MDNTNENSPRGQIIPIGQVHERNTANPIIVPTRTYFSFYHLRAAQHLSKLAMDIENEGGERPRFDIDHRAYVTNSIFSSVAFLEAAINELYQDIVDEHESYVKNLDVDSKRLMRDFWEHIERFNLLEKYQLALTFLRKEQFPKGEQTYQYVSLVVTLRNKLVHYKPESLASTTKHKLTDQLKRKFHENTLMSGAGNPWFPDKCLGHGCTEWVIQSVTEFADKFFDRIGVTPNYQK